MLALPRWFSIVRWRWRLPGDLAPSVEPWTQSRSGTRSGRSPL